MLYEQSGGLYHYDLKNGETKFFGVESVSTNGQTMSSRWSYDKTRYEWERNHGELKINHASESAGIHQSEIEINGGFGSVSSNEGNVNIVATSNYDKFYLFNVNKDFIVDSFSKKIDVKYGMKSLSDEPCRSLISTGGNRLSIMLVPEGVKSKKVHKAIHKKNTIGVFSYLKVSDKNKTINYSAGDYVLVGANSLRK